MSIHTPGRWTPHPVAERRDAETVAVLPVDVFGVAPDLRAIHDTAPDLPIPRRRRPRHPQSRAGPRARDGARPSACTPPRRSSRAKEAPSSLDDPAFLERARRLANFGLDAERDCPEVGLNAKLPELSAVLALHQTRRPARRTRCATRLARGLRRSPRRPPGIDAAAPARGRYARPSVLRAYASMPSASARRARWWRSSSRLPASPRGTTSRRPCIACAATPRHTARLPCPSAKRSRTPCSACPSVPRTPPKSRTAPPRSSSPQPGRSNRPELRTLRLLRAACLQRGALPGRSPRLARGPEPRRIRREDPGRWLDGHDGRDRAPLVRARCALRARERTQPRCRARGQPRSGTRLGRVARAHGRR